MEEEPRGVWQNEDACCDDRLSAMPGRENRGGCVGGNTWRVDVVAYGGGRETPSTW